MSLLGIKKLGNLADFKAVNLLHQLAPVLVLDLQPALP